MELESWGCFLNFISFCPYEIDRSFMGVEYLSVRWDKRRHRVVKRELVHHSSKL